MNTDGVSGEIARDAAFAAYRQSLFALGRTRLALVLALVLAGSLVEGLGVLLLVPLAGAVLGDSSKQALAVLPDWLAGTLAAWGGNGLLIGVLLLFAVSMLLRGAIIVERDHRLVALSSDLVEHWRFRLMRRPAGAVAAITRGIALWRNQPCRRAQAAQQLCRLSGEHETGQGA